MLFQKMKLVDEALPNRSRHLTGPTAGISLQFPCFSQGFCKENVAVFIALDFRAFGSSYRTGWSISLTISRLFVGFSSGKRRRRNGRNVATERRLGRKYDFQPGTQRGRNVAATGARTGEERRRDRRPTSRRQERRTFRP